MKKVFSLKGKKCFSEVYENGVRHRTDSFNAVIVKKCRIDCNSICSKKLNDVEFKVAVITGKKFGKAHERNRARRRIRAVLNEFTLNGKFCMCINVYNGINSKSFAELKTELNVLLIKAGVLK